LGRILVTGSSGLIGSEAVEHYDAQGHDVVGVDNNMRMVFFGAAGDTSWNLARLRQAAPRFVHHDLDIRDRDAVLQLFQQYRFDMVVHCAAQPSHDKAAEIPFVDFDVNAAGTLNLLEAARQHCRDAVFIHMSTNKVYGDSPNELPMLETETRYDYSRPEDYHGINEHCRIDQCLHSLFGASKTAGDVIAQEYGRYFHMKVGVFRGGCLTGPSHSGVPLHGFLSYLVHVAVTGLTYQVLGYKGKQVRDQIHSADVIAAFDAFAADPGCGEVFNLGGGRENSASILECIEMIRAASGHEVKWTYRDQARVGDHICYISDLRKLKTRFPSWSIQHSLPDTISEMVEAEKRRHDPVCN
jgi:CDP-paratose 2-epimerase